MEKSEKLRKLLHTMNDFSTVYNSLKMAIEEYEREDNASVNDLPGFVESYPFDKSFDELPIDQWVHNTVNGIRKKSFKILNYQYLNTGGNCMVGIFEVWLPEELKTIYALVNEEGCNLSVVDYISNDLELDDYDEVIIEYVDWGRVTGFEKYFELYRHCLNVYTKDDCRHFGYTRGLPYHLLSDELRSQVTEEYVEWCAEENGCLIDTDGAKIIVSPFYEPASEEDKMLKAIREFKHWHDTTAGVEEYYNENYKLEFAGHKIELPFMADIWDAVDTMLERTIEDW